MPTDMEFMNRVFHAGLRRDLTRALATLAEGQRRPEEREALVAHLGLVLDLLHHHHTSEDRGLWPLARRRAPDLATQLDRMEAEHAAVGLTIASTRSAASRYAATRDAAGRDAGGAAPAAAELREALEALRDALLPHLDHEETEVMPRVVRALSRRDWSALTRRELRDRRSLTLAGQGLVWSSEGLDLQHRAEFDRQVPSLMRWFAEKRCGRAYRRRVALAFPPTAPAGDASS
jgi:iron-sulfur cluster repair protein YtfE (RIC family)